MNWFDILKTTDPFFVAIDEMVSYWENLHDWYEHIWNQIKRMKNDPVYAGEMQTLVGASEFKDSQQGAFRQQGESVEDKKGVAQHHIDKLTQMRDTNAIRDFYYYLKTHLRNSQQLEDTNNMIYNVLRNEKPAGMRGWFSRLDIPKPPEMPTYDSIEKHTQRLEELFLVYVPGKKQGHMGKWVQRR